MFAEDYERRIKGEKLLMISRVYKSPPEMSTLSTLNSYEWFIETDKKRAPN
jgi:hypothetical protein